MQLRQTAHVLRPAAESLEAELAWVHRRQTELMANALSVNDAKAQVLREWAESDKRTEL